MAEPSPVPDATPIAPETAPIPAPTPAPIENGTPATADVEMKDGAPAVEVPAVQTPNTAAAPIPTPAAVQTPSRNSPLPAQPMTAPANPNPHGSSTRAYLNQNVTPCLLEAMKHLVTAEPDKPLKFLSEYLAKKSAELEGP